MTEGEMVGWHHQLDGRTRLRCPWDYPGKNTGVGCHFLLQCRKVKSESEVASASTGQRPLDCPVPARVTSLVGYLVSEALSGPTSALPTGSFLPRGPLASAR